VVTQIAHPSKERTKHTLVTGRPAHTHRDILYKHTHKHTHTYTHLQMRQGELQLCVASVPLRVRPPAALRWPSVLLLQRALKVVYGAANNECRGMRGGCVCVRERERERERERDCVCVFEAASCILLASTGLQPSCYPTICVTCNIAFQSWLHLML